MFRRRQGGSRNGSHRSDPEQTVLELIPRLYDASVNVDRLPGALDAVEDALGGYYAGVALRFGGEGGPLAFGSEASLPFRDAYVTYAHVIDPVSAHLRCGTLDVGEVFETEQRFPRAEVLRSEYYGEVLRPSGCAWGPNFSAVLAREKGQTTASCIFGRLDGHPRIDAAGRALISLLVPHLVQLHQVWSRLEQAREREARLADALDQMPMAVLLVDARRRVLWASRAAREILSASDGLRVQHGALRADASRTSRILEQRVGAAVRTGTGHGLDAGGALRVPRPSGRRALELRVTPMPRETALSALEMPGAAAVFVTDPEAQPPEAAEVLAALYGLTPAECALATLLCGDLPLSQAAEQLGITLETARQRLKAVFDKTGVRRQSSLVRLLLRGPASLATS